MTLSTLDTMFHVGAALLTLAVVLWAYTEATNEFGLLFPLFFGRKAPKVRVTVRKAPASPVAFARTMGTYRKIEMQRAIFERMARLDDERIAKARLDRLAERKVREFEARCEPVKVRVNVTSNPVNVRRERDAMKASSIDAGIANVAEIIARKASDLDNARKASDEMVSKARAYVARKVRNAEWSDGLIILPVSKRAGEAAMACGNVAMRRELKGEDSNGRKVYTYSLVY